MVNHDVYHTGYVTKKTEYDVNISRLYLMINRINGHFEEKDGDKYLIIGLKNGHTVQKYQEVFDRLIKSLKSLKNK